MAAPVFTLDAAQDLLAAFDVRDDPDSRAFLADLLASGVVPQAEVDILCQTEEQQETVEEKEREKVKKANREKANKANQGAVTATEEPKPKQRPKKRQRTSSKVDGNADYDRLAVTSSTPQSDHADVGTSPFFADSSWQSDDSTDSDWDDADSEGSEGRDGWIVGSARPAAWSPLTTARTVAIVTRRTVLNATAQPETVASEAAASVQSEDIPLEVKAPPASPRKLIPPSLSPSKSTPHRRREATSFFFSPSRRKTKTTTGKTEDTSDTSDEEEPLSSPSKPSRRGLVSGLPFPPLDSPSFGLVQEQLANEPFWLLVALVFLTRVAGRVSLPVFWAIKKKYPTPERLLEADCARLIASMHHLGMSSVRCAALRRYARRWIAQPPRVGVLTTVKNYPPQRDIDGSTSAGNVGSQWEIGHITKGAYAIDSWRIFCRDRLLGRSTDWKGDLDCRNAASQEVFQPEWMRVLPQDKELRACLRWMWMRDGWDWDPETGDRTVLRNDLRRAVNEGRVGYDADGKLQIVKEEARGSST